MIDVERKLFKLYFSSSVLLVFSIVTFSVPWGHWSYTLDRCTGENCGCVLYGKAYSELFVGGRTEYCQFVTFAQTPLLVISVILTFYHGVRAYIKPRREARKNLWRGNPLLIDSRRRRTTDDNLLQLKLEPPTLGGIIALIVTSVTALVLLLTVFGIFVDGFSQSCTEFRHILVRYLGVSGRVAYILNNRLICTSVFDFMDYLQPERRHPDDPFDHGRRDHINTGLSLILAQISLILVIGAWIYASLLNFRLLFAKIRKPKT